jgi:hypothetical protein
MCVLCVYVSLHVHVHVCACMTVLSLSLCAYAYCACVCEYVYVFAKGGRTQATWLLEHGADANAADGAGWTPLTLAAALGQNEVRVCVCVPAHAYMLTSTVAARSSWRACSWTAGPTRRWRRRRPTARRRSCGPRTRATRHVVASNLSVCAYVHVCMYVCMYVCVCVCACVCACVCPARQADRALGQSDRSWRAGCWSVRCRRTRSMGTTGRR